MSSTPMEIVKAYHSVKSFLNNEQKKQVAEMLSLNEEDLTIRIEGKEKEAEFLFRAFSLNGIENIIAFEEGVSRLTDTPCVDFLFLMKNGRRIAVEVKTTKEDKWKISKALFNKKKEFAKSMVAELFFAIKIKNAWMFFPAEYIEKEELKIERSKDYVNSQFNVLGEREFLVLKPIKITSIYNKVKDSGLQIKHGEYGFLENYILEVNSNKVLEINENNRDMIKISINLEGFQDSASKDNQDIDEVSLGPDKTIITEVLNPGNLYLLSHLLVAQINHIESDLHGVYDYSGYVAEMVDIKNKYLIPVDEMELVIDLLNQNEICVDEVIRGKTVKTNVEIAMDWSN